MLRYPGRALMTTLMAASVLVVGAEAHHGFSGRYDVTKPLYVGGRVKSAVFGYPHAVLEIIPDGLPPTQVPVESSPQAPLLMKAGGIVAIELPPVAIFNSLESRIKVGDRIGLIVLRNCDPPHQYRALWVAPVEGLPVNRDRRYQGEVQGC